ncbi:hypothetical protein J2S02_004072 [Metabacillus niabensis]|uniref:DUF3976 domain-containing protein n=1 Tax=Metabacillus niabensis TaxID=324854 RepID=A0ABT9Z649_9BACI|nr:hypothetical protein [Metabacillus niabensis]
MTTLIILLIILISILVFRGVQNGSMQATFKKFVLGFAVTIVFINVIMFFIL